MSNLKYQIITKDSSFEQLLLKDIKRDKFIFENKFENIAEYSNSLGWMNIDEWADERSLREYKTLADKIRTRAEAFIVVGVGGSNQGARAVIEALGANGDIEIIWAGNFLSADCMNKVMQQIQGKSIYVNVIAKNFETLEPGITFRILRKYMKETYGSDYAQRIICTGTRGSSLEILCREKGYCFLPFPTNIGGRFSVLSSVGLLPIAVAGRNIFQLVQGAKNMRKMLEQSPIESNPAIHYAVMRNKMYKEGYHIEMLSSFEPRMMRFSKWWVQLFGESEGKCDKGVFPTFAIFSEDLHSIGQYIQEGSGIMYETFLDIRCDTASRKIEKDGIEDGFEYIQNQDLADINRIAFAATLSAHSKRFPCSVISMPELNEETFGELFYFFEMACYYSARLLDVNPFNQPGVENYKQIMFQKLGKDTCLQNV